MSEVKENSSSQEELDWIELRKELDEIRGREKRKTATSLETWYLPTGLFLTAVFFTYGFYHMNHPTKSIIGAYSRIFCQGFTAIGCVHVFLKFSNEGMPKKLNMEYNDETLIK